MADGGRRAVEQGVGGVEEHLKKLAAIGITALAGAILYAFEGHVDVAHAALVGLPAAAGAVAGTAAQQRVSSHALGYAFSGLLVAIAVWLLLS